MMIGHWQLWKLRRAGQRPVVVWVMLGIPPMLGEVPETALARGTYPTVYLLEDELEYRQDWRFLAGVRVHVQAPTSSGLVVEQAESMAKDGAKQIALSTPDLLMTYQGGEWKAWTY